MISLTTGARKPGPGKREEHRQTIAHGAQPAAREWNRIVEGTILSANRTLILFDVWPEGNAEPQRHFLDRRGLSPGCLCRLFQRFGAARHFNQTALFR
jgi:hypothetical protein